MIYTKLKRREYENRLTEAGGVLMDVVGSLRRQIFAPGSPPPTDAQLQQLRECNEWAQSFFHHEQLVRQMHEKQKFNPALLPRLHEQYDRFQVLNAWHQQYYPYLPLEHPQGQLLQPSDQELLLQQQYCEPWQQQQLGVYEHWEHQLQLWEQAGEFQGENETVQQQQQQPDPDVQPPWQRDR
jgi:hypothetical protein